MIRTGTRSKQRPKQCYITPIRLPPKRVSIWMFALQESIHNAACAEEKKQRRCRGLGAWARLKSHDPAVPLVRMDCRGWDGAQKLYLCALGSSDPLGVKFRIDDGTPVLITCD